MGAGEEGECLRVVFRELESELLFERLMQISEVEEPSSETVVFEQETVNEFCDPALSCRLAYDVLRERELSHHRHLAQEARTQLRRVLSTGHLVRWDDLFAPVLGALLTLRLLEGSIDASTQELLRSVPGLPPSLLSELSQNE